MCRTKVISITAEGKKTCSTSCLACLGKIVSAPRPRPTLLTSEKPHDDVPTKPARRKFQSFAVDPRMVGLTLLRSPVLTRTTAIEVRESLPAMFRFMDWHLCYSPEIHGTSLKTLYRNQKGANVLVIRDTDGGVFGAFCEEAWQPSLGSFGKTPNSFAFRKRNAAAELEVFRTSGACRVQWADQNSLGVDTAIVINEGLFHGTSLPSKAFNNQDSLSVSGEQFTIQSLTCWSLGHFSQD